jgi:DNA-directed RNA polymerase subunit RPC12/RpoP
MSNLKQDKYICKHCGYEIVIHSDMSHKMPEKCGACGKKFEKEKPDEK